MCGITGILHNSRQPVDPGILQRMNDTLRLRGPDDEGSWIDGPVGLAMRRLSIIDVAGGHQPLFNEDQTIAVVCNGEIYNFRELRTALQQKGHRFRTLSDTEVLPHLYEEKGPRFLEDLNGMFALALWDARKQQLILARDRMGKKPLYYYQTSERLLFGSELKALLAHPEVPRELDRTALLKYLAYEYVPAPRSIFRGIHKLPAAHYAIWQPASSASLGGMDRDGTPHGAGENRTGDLQVHRYWEVPFVRNGNAPRSWGEAQEELRHRLRQAVRRRLVSDVPLGVFLSGGIDSSTLVALMVEEMPASLVKTFSIGFEEESFDESHYAAGIANYFGTDHHEEIFTADKMLDTIPSVIDFLDEPLGDASILPTYLLSQFTRRHVTVALGGDGGDELFAGYPTFPASQLARVYGALPWGLRQRWIEPHIRQMAADFGNLSTDFKLKQFVKGACTPAPFRHWIWTGSFSPAELSELLGAPHGLEEVYQESCHYAELAQEASAGNRELYLYLKLYLQDDILTKVDRASMACSLEARAPFLDSEVVEWIAPLPYRWKLRGWQMKALLKATMKHQLPKTILKRPKKGFGIPVAQWIRGPLKEKVFETLHLSRIKREGLFDPFVVQRLLQEHHAGEVDHRKKLWTLLMFEWWYERWGKAGPA